MADKPTHCPLQAAKPDKIEITDEMVAAGVDVYLSSDRRFSEPDDVVYRVFKAMALKAGISAA